MRPDHLATVAAAGAFRDRTSHRRSERRFSVRRCGFDRPIECGGPHPGRGVEPVAGVAVRGGVANLDPRRQAPAVVDRDILSLIHISEPTRLGMISYAVFCLKK